MKCYVLYHHFRIQTPGGRFSKSLRTEEELMAIILISVLTPWLSFHKYAQQLLYEYYKQFPRANKFAAPV